MASEQVAKVKRSTGSGGVQRGQAIGWDERDYELSSQVSQLPSYQLLGNGDFAISMKSVIKLMELAANKRAAASETQALQEQVKRITSQLRDAVSMYHLTHQATGITVSRMADCPYKVCQDFAALENSNG